MIRYDGLPILTTFFGFQVAVNISSSLFPCHPTNVLQTFFVKIYCIFAGMAELPLWQWRRSRLNLPGILGSCIFKFPRVAHSFLQIIMHA